MKVGITRRGENLLQRFQEAGWRVNLHENMPGMLWKKFAYIAGSAAVCAAANCVYEEMRTKLETRALIQSAIEETLAVGRARGAPIMSDSLAWAMDSLDRFPGQGRASMAKDFTEQRPVELEGLTGTVVRMARELDLPTPTNDFLYAILKPRADRIEALNPSGK
jgi:2-dehydropantoate 2-reductase